MLLSRVAADLYWLARYAERAENTARLIDVASRLAALPRSYGETNEWESAMIATGSEALFRQNYETADRTSVIKFLAFDPDYPSSIYTCLAVARQSSRAVRTAITREMWEAINGAWMELKRYDQERMTPRQLAEFLAFVKEACLRFDGSAYRTMLRTSPYYFFRLGVFVERGDAMARMIDVKSHLLPGASGEAGLGLDFFQWSSLLRAASAQGAYQWVFRDAVRPHRVAELLIQRSELPRSIRFCAEHVTRYLDDIANDHGRQGPAQRAARGYSAMLGNTRIDDVFREGLHDFLQRAISENNGIGLAIEAQYLR